MFLFEDDIELSWGLIVAKYFLWALAGAALMAALYFAAPGILAFGAVTSIVVGAMVGLGVGLNYTGISELLKGDSPLSLGEHLDYSDSKYGKLVCGVALILPFLVCLLGLRCLVWLLRLVLPGLWVCFWVHQSLLM